MSALPSAESLPNHWHTFKDKTLELPARIAAKYKAVMATTYYYVGAGTSSVPTGWNNALYWANSSGGTPGAGIPGSADTAIFDANSGYCTLDVAMNITALTLNTGFTKTLSFGSFGSTVSGTVTHTQGTLNTNSQTCTWGQLLSTGSTTRTLSLGSSAITVSLSGGTAWSFTGATNLTISSNTATVTFTGITSITTASLNWNGMSMVISPSSAGTVNFGTTSGTPTLTNLTYSPTAGVGNFLSMFCSLTISTSLTFTGAAAPNAILIESSTLGTARTITCNGTVSFTGQVDFQDITGAGTASWNLSTGLSGNVGGNSGITFATAGSYYYYATANGNYSTLANWYLGSGGTGGAGRVPLPQDTATFNSSSGSITVSFDTPRIGSWIATGFTGTSTLSGTTNCYGNVSLGGTYSGGIYSLSLLGRGLQTFTSNGVSSFAMSVAVGNTGSSTGGGTYTLQDSFSQASTNYLYLRYLNFNANNFNVTTGHIVNDAGTGTITMGSGTWTSLSTGTQACQFTAGTVVPGTSTIVLSGNGASTFAGNGKTFNNLTLSGGSSQVVTLTGANTFNNLTFSGKCTLTLPASTTTTISSLTDNSAGAGVTLNSSTGGTAGTLSCASGGGGG